MINWMEHKIVYLGISGSLLLISFISLLGAGLNPSIDFTGGALIEVRFAEGNNVSDEKLSKLASSVEGVEVNSIQTIDNGASYIIRVNNIDERKKNAVLDAIGEVYKNPEDVRFETVGPTLGKELLIKTGIAILVAASLILAYVAYQFKDKVYGISAVLAMFHDTFLLLGAFSVFGYFYGVEVDTLFVTALLTTLSFSVHDTIVVFDRIREKLKDNPKANFKKVINNSVTETLPRSLNNSMTIIFMLSALTLLGGSTIRWFVVALLVGTISGTYSSTFVAAPLLLILTRKLKNK